MRTETEMPAEVTDERIYDDLKAYSDAGLIEYVLPTESLGEQWIVGWNGDILKFVTKEGIVGFLTGLQVCAGFVAKMRNPNLTESLPVISALLRSAGYDPVDGTTRSVTKGDTIRIIPERGPERVMVVSHVEHHLITLSDPGTAEGMAAKRADR